MSRLFKRFMTLSLIKPTIQIAQGHFFQTLLPNATTITQMQVKFSIEKGLGKQPNKAAISIVNLAESTRVALKKPLIVRLAVGYDGAENEQHLFSGDLRIASTIHDGPHVVTNLEMGDGDTAFQFGSIRKSYSNSKLIDAITDVAGSLGVKVPTDLRTLAGQQRYTGVLSGPSHRELSKLLTPLGSSWSIQDGTLVALKETQVREGEAVVIREGDGMVGSPQFGTSKKPGEPPKLNVKLTIDPRIRAGGKISVKSRDIDGLFRVENVRHTGEFRGKDWYTEVVARAL
jgi:hypothetical protein